MSTPTGAQLSLAVYLDHLLLQLRLLDVPGEQIGQILAEVETHVGDTGLDPVHAFGEPGVYAATYAAEATAPRPNGRLRVLGVALSSAFAGVAVFMGATKLVGSVDITARFLAMCLATAAVGSLLFDRVLGPLLARDTARSMRPPRFTSRFMVLGVLAYLAGVAVLLMVWLLPAGPTLLSLPGWALLIAGLLAFLALVRRLGGDRVVDPRG